MPGLDELKGMLADLFHALVWLLAFFLLVAIPVNIAIKWLLIFFWCCGISYAIYRNIKDT